MGGIKAVVAMAFWILLVVISVGYRWGFRQWTRPCYAEARLLFTINNQVSGRTINRREENDYKPNYFVLDFAFGNVE